MIITLQFPNINVSCQVGDIAYASIHQGRQSGRNHPGSTANTKPFVLGLIQTVNRTIGNTVNGVTTPVVVINTNAGGGPGTTLPYGATVGGLYVFFQKSQLINTSGVIGYFLETEYRNYSTLPAEMFATAVDYVESSK